MLCSQLKLSHPDHTLVKRASAAEESFDRAVQSVAWRPGYCTIEEERVLCRHIVLQKIRDDFPFAFVSLDIQNLMESWTNAFLTDSKSI